MNKAKAHREWLESHEAGYHKSIGNRQVQMIAIGGSIGTGLFLGAGARLQAAGPSLAIVYILCGLCAFMVLRALGELVMHRPSSGSFVSYAREFLGEKGAFIAGWAFFLNWAMTGIVDSTAVALYVKYWPLFADVPQWVTALVCLVIVGSMNLAGVKWFAEMEFWFALIKVLAIGLFLAVGSYILGTGGEVAGQATGISLVTANGGLFPHGLIPPLVLVQGVIFAFAGVELVGTAAGEAKDARKMVPRAINGVIWRIAILYVGSVALLVCLMPWNAYQAGTSPFVTFFSALGVPGIGSAINLVVMTAALSSLNSGLYSTGRVLRALSQGGSAPEFLSKMSKSAVPYAGILVTLGVYVFGLVLNYLVPSEVFEIVLNIASVGILTTWAMIVICQMKFRQAVKRGEVEEVAFKMPGAPVTSWITLVFLFSVLALMAFDYPTGSWTVGSIPLLALAMVLGWRWLAAHRRARLPSELAAADSLR